jgi:pilin isopeptide linkage protein/uncharacterized repeat protein (TIGR01451 family)
MKHEPRKKKQTFGRLPLGHRALALLLALLMVFTATGMQVFADEGDGTDGTESPADASTQVVEETPASTTTPEVETTPTDTTTVDTPAETTPSEDPATATATTTPADTTDQTGTGETTQTPAEPTGTAVPTETPEVSAEEGTEETGTTPDPYNIADKITGSAMNYYPDGETPTAINGATVTAGAYVAATLEFGKIEGIEKGQKLTYTIPSSYVTAYQITESDNGQVIYYQVSGSGEKVPYVVGTYTVSGNLVTITPSEDYLNADTDKIDLPGGQFSFTGNLAVGAGEASLTFGKADPLKFTVKAAARLKVAARSADTSYDLTNSLQEGSYINVIIGDKEYSLADLTATGKKVPAGAGVHVKLVFGDVPGIEAGQTLTYQIPKELVVQATSTATKLADSKNNKPLGSFVIDENGVITVTIYDSYFNTYAQNGTLDLQGFNLFFYGSFSDSMGQEDGSDDNKISFSGNASSSGLTFTIPFDYKNDHANVQIEKNGVFDPATKTISYTVTVTAPKDNTENAYNVVVTDDITAARDFIKTDSNGNWYQNYSATNGSFDPSTGVWTLSGDMKPGQTETLTYDLVVNDGYFTNNPDGTPVENKATVTFNDNGKNEDTDKQDTPGTVLVEKKAADALGQDDTGTFVTYTLTATAYNAEMGGIVVKDAFDTPDSITSIAADSPSQGTVALGSDNKSFTWTIGKLGKDQSATLTYKAYLDPLAWETGAYENYISKNQVSSNAVRNTATVSVNNSGVDGTTGGDPIETDTRTVSKSIEKTWLDKSSAKIESGDHSGQILFTVKANGAPSTNIVKIWDQLSDGSYESDGKITLSVYNSSVKKDLYKSVTINIADVMDSSLGTGWTIDLTKVPTTEGEMNLSGTYYYELTYYVDATGLLSFNNTAGLGLGSGKAYSILKSVQGSEGWTKNTDFKKESNYTVNYEKGETYWNAYVYKTVTADVKLWDHTSTAAAYGGFTYFDEDCFDRMVVTVGNETLVRGVDYEIEGDTKDMEKASASMKEFVKDKYSGFYFRFLRTIEASKDNPIHISYIMKVNNAAFSTGDSVTNYTGNYFDVFYYVYGKEYRAYDCQNDYVWGGWLDVNRPLEKSNGKYHADSGTVTWDIKVNKTSSIAGNATLIDLLPEGLTFVSATIDSMGEAASVIGTTVNGKTVGAELTAADLEVDENYTENGTKYTKVTFSVENLSRFQKVDGGKLVDNTDSYTENGTVKIVITAKVDPDVLATLDSEKTVTNKAILTGNDYLPEGGVTSTNNATIPATGSTVVSKSQATQESPAYVQFALNINSNALDLVAGDGTLTVDDVMGTGMTMATSHENCFKVYDVTGKTAEWSSDGATLAVQAADLGTDITESCSWEATEEANTYRFTVPDRKHVVIVYWAVFSGVEGQTVSLTNNAYFFYEGHDYSNNASKWQASLQVGGAGGDAYTNPYFYLQKQDQWGNNVSGATFAVYEYDRNTGKDGAEVARRTTEDGQAYIGHRATDDNNSFPILSLNTIYGIKEVEAPAGYTLDSTEHYFEFIDLRDSNNEVSDDAIKNHQESHPEGITVIDLSPGGTYTVTNHFAGASAQIPVAKTINGKNLSSTTDFSFTLQQITSDDGSKLTVYTDEDYKGTLPTTGLKKTITGSGSDYFDPLYFKETGTYTFSLTEDSLSSVALNRGFSEENRDQTEYKVTVVVSEVDKDGKKTIEVTKITYAGGTKSGDILQSDVPTFNNGLKLEGTLKLRVKKTVTGRAAEVAEGEFAFTVLNDGEAIKDQYGNALIFETENGGMVNISIPLTQDDIGDHDYVIKEVVPTTEDPSISYDASPVIASVTIGEVSGANGASVAAITDVTYTADQTEDGVPLMVNKYVASGSLKLQGTKKFLYGTQEQAISEGQFNFVVMEGNTQVATGTTKSGYQDNIEFTEINYVAADIGKHTYTISEVDDGQMFVEYTDKVVTVNVEVKDAGDGKLEAVATYEGDTDDKDISGHALFVNTCTFIIPSGIRLDVLPYVLIVLLALGCGALLLRRRKHMRG